MKEIAIIIFAITIGILLVGLAGECYESVDAARMAEYAEWNASLGFYD
jgi:hypothetical protein